MPSEAVAGTVEAVKGRIESWILSGELQPGAHVNENAVAERLGVSRTRVREACRLLERVNLVRIVPNQGAFVAALSLPEVINLFDIRATLGRLAGELAAASSTPSHLERLRGLIGAMDAAARARDAEAYTGLNLDFHGCLYQMTGNHRLEELDWALGKELRLYRRHGLAFGGGLLVSNQEHRVILDAIESGDCAKAGAQLEKHIRGGRDRFLHAMSATGQLVLQVGAAGAAPQRTRRPSRPDAR